MNEHVDETIDAYCLGILDADEMARVEEHLGTCARCRALLQATRNTAGALLYAAPQVAPPPALKSKLLARIHILSAQAGETQPAQDNSPVARIRQLLGQLLDSSASAGGDSAIALLKRLTKAPDAQIWDVGGTNDAPAAFARLVGTPHGKNAVLVTAGLAGLSPDRAYQIWLLRDGTPLPNLIFRVDQHGRARQVVRVPGSLDRFNAIAVTPEPAGGSPAPTGPIVLMGTLSA
jgi:anti-sigma-K factor RskA